MTEQQGPEEDDASLVGRYLTAEREARSTGQRAARAQDRLHTLRDGVRAADRAVEQANARLTTIHTVRGEEDQLRDVIGEEREAVVAAALARQEVNARGAKGRQARERLAAVTARGPALRERHEGHRARIAELSEQLGTMDPRRWQEMQREDETTVDTYEERRAAALAEANARRPALLAAAEAANRAAYAAAVERDQVERDVAARGLDGDRLREIAAGMPQAGPYVVPADPRTEAALAVWQERQAAQQQACCAERADRQREDVGRDREPER